MSDTPGNDNRRSTGSRTKKSRSPAKKGPGGTRTKSSGDVGRALRSVYDTTLSERVPDDFLDLLGKLS